MEETRLIGAHQFDFCCCCGWQTAVCDLPSKWVCEWVSMPINQSKHTCVAQ